MPNSEIKETRNNKSITIIISKIKSAQLTNRQFKPRFGWQVEF
ncbi:MAG: hypothetical protein NTZ42_01405 [Candidatus Gribaldobacteria bacterium]|nr:hypothetical protein [Candidatus Gribaldobacteria bacterium]